VVDFKLFKPYQGLKNFTVMIGEQYVVGMAVVDVTPNVAFGYWPSYNVPYTPVVAAQFQSTKNDYEMYCRATIFRHRQAMVHNIEDFRSLLRYNDYLNDPLAVNDPMCAISSRADLYNANPSLGLMFGGIDTKVTSYSMKTRNGPSASWIQSGPTHQGLQPFTWNIYNFTVAGQPATFDFDWVFFSNQ